MGELTNPTWFRSGKNVSGTTLTKRRFMSPGTGVGEVILPAAVTTIGAGVTTEDIPDQATGSLQYDGVALVECSVAIALNALIQSGTDGRAAAAASGSMIRGIARSATSNAGEFCEVELWKGKSLQP
jgi:hypothetical protein